MFKGYLNYIKDNPNGYWFKAKLFGWGWTPAKWQGWAIMIVFIGIIFWIASKMEAIVNPTKAEILNYLLQITILVLILIVICYVKGEKPRWQWGLPKSENK